MLTASGCINVIDASQLDDDDEAELDPRLCFSPYGIDSDWYAERFEGFPPQYYQILAGLHQKALADAELLEKKEQKIMLLEDVPEEKIEEVE